MASVLEPPPPAPLWNLFTALGGLLEEAPRSCVQAKRGRQLETGTLGEAEAEASGNEALSSQKLPRAASPVLRHTRLQCLLQVRAGCRSQR